MSVVLYYMPFSPYCRAVLLMGRTLGIKMDLRTINLTENEHLKPEFMAINPQHTIPTMVDGDLVLWESRAIMTYLVGMYGKGKGKTLYPEDPITRAKVDSLLYFDIGTLVPRWRAVVHPLMKGLVPKPTQESLDQLDEAIGWLESTLGRNAGKYSAGTEDLTVADYALVALVSTFEAAEFFSGEKYPITKAWLDGCKNAMEGYQEVNGESATKFGQFIQSKIKN